MRNMKARGTYCAKRVWRAAIELFEARLAKLGSGMKDMNFGYLTPDGKDNSKRTYSRGAMHRFQE
jgi:hypothetical protein